MNVIELPNLNENPHITQQTIINDKSYTFNYNWVDDFATLDIYSDDTALIVGRAITTASDLIGRVKDDDLITGSLYLINKYGNSVQPTQETLHTDFYLAWVE